MLHGRMPYEPKDKLFHRAKELGFRSRAAFKLQEIQKKHRLLKRGDAVLDLGSSPGAWAQVACEIVGPQGNVYGIDLVAQKSDEKVPANFHFFCGDVLQDDTHLRFVEALGVAPEDSPRVLDVVLSDLSPKLTGIAAKDAQGCLELAHAALEFAKRYLKAGGHLVLKTFPGPEMEPFRRELKSVFETQKLMTLDATRSTSREVYLVGLGFKPGRS